MLTQLKQVNWETLGGILQLPSSQRRKIEAEYTGEAERKKGGVRWWIWNCPYASWRWLITRLDIKGEHAVADQIRGYAEKLTGMSGFHPATKFWGGSVTSEWAYMYHV